MIQDKTLWTALITPMYKNGSIDYESLEKVIRRQEKAGNGILLIGSTGEGLALSGEDKRDVVKFAAGLEPDVPLMVGVGGMNIERQRSWIETCNSLAIDAFLMVTPLYAKPGPKGQYQWFRQLLDASDKPAMLYNIPSRTGIELPVDVARKLKDHPRFWSVKEASGSIERYLAFRENLPSIQLFSGDDAMFPFFSRAGCSGLVSVASNVWPKATKLYVEKSLRGETEEMIPLWDHAVKALFSVSNPIPAKKLLYLKGVIGSAALRLPLSTDELENMEELEAVDEEIENWYIKNKTT